MTYTPITSENVDQWTEFLTEAVFNLDFKTGRSCSIFGLDVTDVDTAKDLVGTLLATITKQPVTIN